jgi:hypothetical protein
MKKIYSLSLFVMVAVGAFAQSVPFTGTGLLTANSWAETGTAPPYAGPLTIITTASDSGNSLAYAGLAASSGNRTRTTHNDTQDVNLTVTSITTGTAYYSVLIKALNTDNMLTNTNAGEYFLHFSATVGSGSGTFVGRIYVKQGATANTFNLGVLNNSGGTATPTYSTAEYAVNQTNLIVVKYDLATNSASIFINPATLGAAEPAVATATNATGTSAAPTQIAGINIRQAGSATASVSTGNIEIDEIRVGTTFASVTPINLSVKQNDIAGLSIFPNPVTNGTLNINSDANAERNVVLFDVLGKQVLKVTTSNASINVAKLNAGVYIVKITEEGKTATRKLVIQ